MLRFIARWSIQTLASLAVGATLVAFLWPLVFPVSPPDEGFQVLALIILAALNLWFFWLVRVRPQDGKVSLERGTVAFADYYRAFYELEGYLSIFCEDSEWLEGAEMKRVVDAIGLKGVRATMFLSVLDEPITKQLAARGVRVVQVPQHLALEVKMSLRVNGTDRDLIIRGAGDGTTATPWGGKKRKEMNVFTRTKNSDILNMVQAVFGAMPAPSPRATDETAAQ